MPELPEVQTVVNTLQPAMAGQVIRAVDLRRRDIVSPADIDFPQQITGKRVISITRRAKRIVFLLNDGNRFYIHLGMSGHMSVEKIGTPTIKHTHLILHVARQEVRFVDPRRFGGIWWLGKEQPWDTDLGPEPLDITAKQLAARLAKTTRAIKPALLDQKLIVGLGNIYVDESLHQAGIHPTRRADKLRPAEVAKLTRCIKTILRQAIEHNGSSVRTYRDANGKWGSFQNLHRVYHCQGKPCHRCKTPIQQIVLGGRSTHFCPKCQVTKPHA